MNLVDIAVQEHAIFKTWGNDFSYPIATPLQREMREAVLRELGISWSDLDGDEDLGKAYLEKLEKWAKGVIFGMKYRLYERAKSKPAPTGTIKQRTKMKRIRPKQFSRRFNIVMFITDWLDHTGRNRVNWPQVAAQWNKENSLDQYENPSSLERLYNKARKEDGIMVQIEAMSSPEAIQKLADSQDLKDWHDGKPHLRIIKTPLFTVEDFTTGKKGG